MDMLKISAPANNKKVNSARRAAFSLVEVVMAIGIMSISFVTVFGLLPTGLNTFRQSVDTSIGSQVAQHVINDAQQADFSALITDYQNTMLNADPKVGKSNITGLKAYRFFDDQGNEVIPASSGAGDPKTAPGGLSPAEKLKIIYWVNTRIMPATATPKTGTPTTDNLSLATVTVQIANNPGNLALAFEPGVIVSAVQPSDQNTPTRNLWNGAYATNPTTKSINVKTFSALVARSK